MGTPKPTGAFSTLQVLDPSKAHEFRIPTKHIDDGEDMDFWLTSKGYIDIMKFLLQLNISMFPTKHSNGSVDGWFLDSNIQLSSPILQIQSLLSKLEKIIEEAPPDPGPRRFGNISFRKWYEFIENRADELLKQHLPQQVLNFDHSTTVTPLEELKSYFLGSFGSAQRLDYGTGHELSFLAFIGCLWKLGGFSKAEPGVEERGIVIGIIEPYLHLIRSLILTYTLEPAGSHGVWGLDDHSFIPYIFGSAQLSPAISLSTKLEIPAEGSFMYAPKTNDVAKKNIVERERKRNMYFSAIGFIYDVKKGPFWEHSPILFDVSGVTAGWAKINKGMIKMYNAEVLGKFPVVQHFPFGSLFAWEKDPETVAAESSAHMRSHLTKGTATGPSVSPAPAAARSSFEGTKAPWATGTGSSAARPFEGMKAPWATEAPTTAPRPAFEGTKAPWASGTGASTAPPPFEGTKAPWVTGTGTSPLPPTGVVGVPRSQPTGSRPTPAHPRPPEEAEK